MIHFRSAPVSIGQEGGAMSLIRLAMMEDETVISSLFFYTVRLPSRYLGVIEEVNTLPEYQRRGYATHLIKIAIQLAKEKGCDCVELTVREDSPAIQAFYQSLGFFDRLNRAYRLNLGGR